MVLFLCISFVFYGFTKANYGGYTQAVLFFKYRQCIIIAPIVRRNFLCISLYFMVLFLMYFFYMFYGFIKAITEAKHRWFHFLSAASV